jgi:formiminotetrahydrofolate cyclodeaminase
VSASAERRFGELLDEVAARTPAPGGGSATAWAGAVAAGLTEMSAEFAGAGAASARAAALRAELLASGERELHAYEPVLAAQRAGGEGLTDALSAAAEPPLAIARATVEVAELAAELAASGRPSLTGDAVAGALLAEAAAQSAARLVELNLARVPGDPRLAEVGALRRRAAAVRKAVLTESGPGGS